MAKTLFQEFGTVVTAKFLNAVFGQGADGGHKHDGKDKDGHCAKITKDELDETVREFIYSVVSDKFIGDIRAYAGRIAPAGYLVCNGASVPSSAEYENFRKWIDRERPDLNINGDYRTPDLRGRVLIGAGEGTDENGKEIPFAIGESGGEYEHKLTANEVAKHGHGVRMAGAGSGEGGSLAPFYDGADDGVEFQYDYQHLWRTKTDAAGQADIRLGDQPHNNIQPYAGVNYIIRAV